MLLFMNSAFVPCTVLTCDVTVHALKKEKEKEKAENANMGLEMQIQTHTKSYYLPKKSPNLFNELCILALQAIFQLMSDEIKPSQILV